MKYVLGGADTISLEIILSLNDYLKEHHQIFALSEPLDWEHDWTETEYRIGE